MFNSPILLDFNNNSNGSTGSSGSSSSAKRSKITKACDNCRRRRVKCDGVPEGCGGCKAAKTQCVYSTSNTKRGPPKGYVEVIEDRLGKIENMLTSIVRRKTFTPQDPSDNSSPVHSDFEDISSPSCPNTKSKSKSRNKSSNASVGNDTDNDNDNDNDNDDENYNDNDNDMDDHASTTSVDLVKVKKQPPASPSLHSNRSCTPAGPSSRAHPAMSTLGRHSPLVSRQQPLSVLLPFAADSGHYNHPGAGSGHGQHNMPTHMLDSLGSTSVPTTLPFPWLSPEQSLYYGRNHRQFSIHSLEPPLPVLARSLAPALAPEKLNMLLGLFFDRFNNYLPIVHRSIFMKQWQRESCRLCCSSATVLVSRSGSEQDLPTNTDAHREHMQDPVMPLSPLLLNAVLAVASMVPIDSNKTQESGQRANPGQDYFDNARLLLDDFLDVPRVSTVQALCLMSQFHQQGHWKATRSSGYLSMAIRMAHELGLNRDPEKISGPEADALRCLWWSMFVLDHQFSTWQGLGLLMHGKDSNVDLPIEFSASPNELRGFVCLVQLVKILGNVLQHSYSTQSLPPQFGGHDSMVSYIEGTLTSWLGSLSPEMRWHHPNGAFVRKTAPNPPIQQILARDSSKVYPAYLYIVYNTTLILLHRPYIVGAAGSPTAAQSNTICTGSGRAITDISQGLDMKQCSYVVNRFALYALLQAGVIHAMNAVYDKRGSEVAMEYYRRTLSILEGFLACSEYSGGVAEGIKILEQFLINTSMAAAEEEGAHQNDNRTPGMGSMELDDNQPFRKKRQVDASGLMQPLQYQHQPYVLTSPITMTTLAQSSASLGSMTSMSSPMINSKEQQKQQQLFQQQQQMYQHLQSIGTPSVIKVEPNTEDELKKMQQQLLRQQLQHQMQQHQQQQHHQQHHQQQQQQQQQQHQLELELKEAAPLVVTPVIPSHRYAMQMLQQQQQLLQQSSCMPMTMTMTMSTMAVESQGRVFDHSGSSNGSSSGSNSSNGSSPMAGESIMTSSVGSAYDPTQLWTDFSSAGSPAPLTGGIMNPAGLEHDAFRLATVAESQNQFGAGGGGTPLWM